jgi:hypothetical protein
MIDLAAIMKPYEVGMVSDHGASADVEFKEHVCR